MQKRNLLKTLLSLALTAAIVVGLNPGTVNAAGTDDVLRNAKHKKCKNYSSDYEIKKTAPLHPLLLWM